MSGLHDAGYLKKDCAAAPSMFALTLRECRRVAIAGSSGVSGTGEGGGKKVLLKGNTICKLISRDANVGGRP